MMTMTTGGSSIFVDTNVLVFSTNAMSPSHLQALNALQHARNAGMELIISPQILREYLSAATRPLPRGSGMSVPSALTNFRLFQTQYRIVNDNQAVLHNLDNLLQNFVGSGKQIYDANIVATMQVYGITRLLTNNVADFNRFASLITVVPL